MLYTFTAALFLLIDIISVGPAGKHETVREPNWPLARFAVHRLKPLRGAAISKACLSFCCCVAFIWFDLLSFHAKHEG